MCHRRMDPSSIHLTRLTLANTDVHVFEVAGALLALCLGTRDTRYELINDSLSLLR